jgi:hypothetical protein
MAKEEEEFSYKKISVWWLCMVEFWMSAYDCCRASTAVRSAEAVRKISHRESDFTSPVNNYNRNPEIAMKEIPTEPEPSDQLASHQAEAARKISHRESEFHESREQLQQKPRNRDERNPD